MAAPLTDTKSFATAAARGDPDLVARKVRE